MEHHNESCALRERNPRTIATTTGVLNFRDRFLSLAAACVLGMLLGGCANDGRFDHPGPPHPGAANPWASERGWGPGPNYPETGR